MSSPEYGTNEHVSANRPISPYANTKRMGEMLCFMYTQVWGIETVALRLFTVYGPYGRRDMAITKFVRNMMLSLPIDVYGDPKTTYRDYTHVSDIVDGFAKACTYKMLTSNHTMNLGSNNPTTLETMIKTIEQHFGYQAVRNNMSMQKGDVVRTNAHIEEAEQKMGWSPRMSFERGIKDYVKWYRETMTPNLSSSELES